MNAGRHVSEADGAAAVTIGGRELRSLANPRFRLLLLAVFGLPLLVSDLQTTLLPAFLDAGFKATDFSVYMQGARDLRAGEDPYSSFFSSRIFDPTLNLGYIYPPLLAWVLQPLVPLGIHTATALAEVVEQACLAGFVLLLRPILTLRSWEATAWIYVLVISWFPVRENLYGAQVNVLLLLLVALAVLCGRRAVAGAPVALTFAVKFLTAPLLPYLALRRRWAAVAVAAATLAVAWLVAAPWWLPEYAERVFPAVGMGTGFRENIAPSGTLIRLFSPGSLYGQPGAPPEAARWLTYVCSAAVVALTAYRLGARERRDRTGYLVEFSAVVAAAPLIATLTWPSHAVLLLLPISVLIVEAWRLQDSRVLGLVVAGTVLLGPVRSIELTLIAAGVNSPLVIRPLAETGVLGLALVFAASLRALGWSRPGPRAARV